VCKQAKLKNILIYGEWKSINNLI